MDNIISNFLKEYEELCKKYNISLAHEDCHGAFILEEYNEDNIEWVKYALDKVSISCEKRKQKEKNEKLLSELTLKLQQCLIGEGFYSFKSVDEVWGVYDDDKFIRKATDYEKDLIQQIRKLNRIIKYN